MKLEKNKEIEHKSIIYSYEDKLQSIFKKDKIKIIEDNNFLKDGVFFRVYIGNIYFNFCERIEEIDFRFIVENVYNGYVLDLISRNVNTEKFEEFLLGE